MALYTSLLQLFARQVMLVSEMGIAIASDDRRGTS